MKNSRYILYEKIQSSQELYHIDWDSIKKRVGSNLVEWINSLPKHLGQPHIYKIPQCSKIVKIRVVMEFYDSAAETEFCQKNAEKIFPILVA